MMSLVMLRPLDRHRFLAVTWMGGREELVIVSALHDTAHTETQQVRTLSMVQRVHAMLGSLHQNSDVVLTGQRAVNRKPQELGAGNNLH